MLDKVEYWLNLCDDNLKSAKLLFNGKQFLDAGFFCHQIAEKALKAVVASVTQETPPKIHDLKKLSKIGGISTELSAQQLALLEKLVPLQIEARYPEYKCEISKTLDPEFCKKILSETEDFLCWIKQWLGR